MTAQPAEPLTRQEREQFAVEFERLGETIVAQMLRRRGVGRFSYLRKVDRIIMLAAIKRTRRA